MTNTWVSAASATGSRHEPHVKVSDALISDTPTDEVTNGVFCIYITNYGDSPGTCFAKVIAESEARALEVLARVHKTIEETAVSWYAS